jgi:hypothetical protein
VVSILRSTVGDLPVYGRAILEVRDLLEMMLIPALFIVGFFEWGLVYFTNWQKQVKIASARYTAPMYRKLIIRMEEDSIAEEAVAQNGI